MEKGTFLRIRTDGAPDTKGRQFRDHYNQALDAGDAFRAAAIAQEAYYRDRSPDLAIFTLVCLDNLGLRSQFNEFCKYLASHNPSVIGRLPERLQQEFYRAHPKRFVEVNSSLTDRVEDSKTSNRWPVDIAIDGALIDQFCTGMFQEINGTNSVAGAADGQNRFLSIGSCFAVNIGRSLENKGVLGFTVNIEERLNNSAYIESIFRYCAGERSDGQGNLDDDAYASFQTVPENLRESSHIIVTLGVSLVFRDPDGQIYLGDNPFSGYRKGHLKPDILSADENHRIALSIVENIRKMSDARIVFSVSPVPLTWSGSSQPKVILDDIDSKMNLRSGVLRAVSEVPDVLYWPSFEVVKWLGAHSRQPFFHGDHIDSRHVQDHVVDAITASFMRVFGLSGASEAG